MRIAMVGPFGLRKRGTMWRRALPLAKALVRRGHRVGLFLPPWDSPADSGRAWTDQGVSIVNVPGRHPATLTAHLLRAILAYHPDIVHAFKPKAYAGFIVQALWYARQTGLWRGRLIVDADDWEGAGGWNARAGYPKAAQWLFAWQEAWGFRHADVLTVASRWLATQAERLGAYHVVYVPNGVDLAHWPPRPMSPSGPPTALLLTRFIEFAPGRLADIWAAVQARLPKAHLVVAGGALRDEAHIARCLLEAASPHASVRWLGPIPYDALPSLCAKADLALFPADAHRLNRAKCPARLVDMMAAGLPVVASRVGEHETYVVHGETGLLVPPGDTAALAQAVVWLLSDPEEARRMGQAGRRRVAAEFTWDHLAPRVEAAYALNAPSSQSVDQRINSPPGTYAVDTPVIKIHSEGTH